MNSYEFFIDDEEAGERIDKYLASLLPDYSRSYIQKMIADGNVQADGRSLKANYRIRTGDHLTVAAADPVIPEIVPENIPLDILYEDSDILVVNKPRGMVVHPALGHYSGTLVNAVMYHCRDDLSTINGVLRPGIVHRIDKDTTGVLVVCKNDIAHRKIAEQLSVHSITRRYRALVYNNIKEDTGTVDAPIGHIPVFVREGSILPMEEELTYAEEKADAPLHLRLYPYHGSISSPMHFLWYEDAGDDYGYEKGIFNQIDMTYDQQQRVLSIGSSAYTFDGGLAGRDIVVSDGETTAHLHYDGREMRMNI